MKHIGDVLDGKEKKGIADSEDRYARHLQKVDEWMRNRLEPAAYSYWSWCYGEGDRWAEGVHKQVSDIVAGRAVKKEQPWMFDIKDYQR